MRRAAALLALAGAARGDCTPPHCYICSRDSGQCVVSTSGADKDTCQKGCQSPPQPTLPAPPHPTPKPPPQTEATLVKLTGHASAVCLDGSPAGYYVQQTGSPNWIIFLVGGGSCSSQADCVARSKTHMGSSLHWPRSAPGNPFPSTLRGWNFVQVQYCSGDDFGGTRGEYAPWGVHFAGHEILDATVRDLQQRYGMGSAGSQVMLSGDSSGGHGVYLNAEWLRDHPLMAKAAVLAAPFAGWYFPNVTTYSGFLVDAHAGWEADPQFWQDNAQHNRWGTYMPKSCVKANPDSSDHLHYLLCTATGYLVRWMTLPTFVVENQFDPTKTYSLGCEGCKRRGLQGQDSAAEHYVAYTQYYASRVEQGVAEFMRSNPGNGLFFPSCYDHDSNLWDGSQPGYNDTMTGPLGPTQLAGASALEALAEWVAGHAGPPPKDVPQRDGWRWHDSCSDGCTPCSKGATAGKCTQTRWRSCTGPVKAGGANQKCPTPPPPHNHTACSLRI